MERSKKQLKEIALRIAQLEHEMSLGKNVNSITAEILEISETLSLKEMLIVDELVQEII